MKQTRLITLLCSIIAAGAALAASLGIFSGSGPGPHNYVSIRGRTVAIWGQGLYQDMSAEVAPQGIAQDYVTLFFAIPLLLVALLWSQSSRWRGQLMLAGVIAYFLVTYLFYLMMAMYQALFLLYVILLATSFFTFLILITSINPKALATNFRVHTPVRKLGGFLVFVAVCIASLWLSIVIPPLLDGSMIPIQVEHYTTLVVQGLDLSILLPAAIITGTLFIRKRPLGYLFAPVYFVFLSLLMTALTAKVIAMSFLGQNVVPVVFVIPTFNIASIVCAIITFRNIDEPIAELITDR